jgi:hypothetical protein
MAPVICFPLAKSSHLGLDIWRKKKNGMNTHGIRGTLTNSSKFLSSVFWHVIVVPLVSFVASFAALFVGIFLIVMFGQLLGRALCFTMVGFCGVLSGALCMTPATRRFGALALTLLGVIFYSGCVTEWGNVGTDEGTFVYRYDQSLAETLLLAFGGLLATIAVGWSSLEWLWRKRDGIIRRLPISNH